LSLLVKAMRTDVSVKRVAAFAKRLLQADLQQQWWLWLSIATAAGEALCLNPAVML